ncbi:hypothetical protein [Propionibacterium australiense]|uniref:Uncharacterized protein n=1 Tax=Propionibacterium australiense TaxID=119981 RepID=A0A383S8E4_9ACTN|nr:hypothetical protein [Propionibacterium australiense]RLP07500.1 hypothetical protein D9T14_10300 [Propionibacterium australiense]SYZ34103.1 Hypothetical protein PROPAUS_2105 [Propionibacterium australiense]VEH88692.1 Uncharacterised protein [Propionibacterium australiense]
MSTPQQPGTRGTERSDDWASRPARPADGWQPGQATHTGMPATTGPAGAPSPTRRIVIGSVVLALLIGTMTAAALTHSVLEKKQRAVQEAVRAYLTAVAEADAEKARGYLGEVDDDSLLTDEVLRASNERAPLTGITVGKVTRDRGIGSPYHVQVSYLVGDEEVSAGLDVGLTNGPVIINASSLRLGGLKDVGVMVNGAVPDTTSPTVFPGSYLLTTRSEYLEVTGEPIAAIDPTKQSYSLTAENSVVVSEAGVQMFREKVVAEARKCLASTSLDPGCGIEVPQYPDSIPGCAEIREDSVHRRQDISQAALLESVTPSLKPMESTTIWALFMDLGRIDITAACRLGDTWSNREITRLSGGFFFGSPSIDLTDPDLTITWDA